MEVLKPLIGVINLSTKLSNNDVKTMVIACQEQLKNDVAPHWLMDPAFVIFYDDPAKISLRAYPIVILDSPDAAATLGYHAERNGRLYGRVFIEPIINNGGVILSDPYNPQNTSIAASLSRAIIGHFIDKNVNKWVDGPPIKQGSYYAYEACNPVQGSQYNKKIGSVNVSLANFVLPSWFDPNNPSHNPVDFLESAPGAFQLAPGGYMVIRCNEGYTQQVFGEVKAEWLKELAKVTCRRLANKPKIKKKSWWQYL